MDAIINYGKRILDPHIAHRAHKGLGIVSCEVLGFNDAIEYSRIQHVSWNYISKTKQYVLFSEIEAGSTIFYVAGRYNQRNVDELIYISENRNYSKNIGVSLNVSIDTGIIIYDTNTKASRYS